MAVEPPTVQPRIADICVELRDVGAGGGRSEEAVRIEVGVDIITAQVEAEDVAERDLQPRVAGEILVAVLLGPDRRRRNAVGAKISADRKSVVSGKSVSVRVDLGGRRNIKKKDN